MALISTEDRTSPFARQSPPNRRSWLDEDGCFRFGKYAGRFVAVVAEDDPSYVRWIIETVDDIDAEDLRTLEQLVD